MANQEQLDILKEGTKVWNAWREKHPVDRVKLSGASLLLANLSVANLSWAAK